MLGRALVQGPVAQRLPHRRPVLAEPAEVRVEIRAGKLVPDVILGHFRRVQHIRRVEAVVTQIIRQQLKRRKVGHAR